MTLADDLRDLSSRSLAALDASHDYYTFTKRLWRLLQKVVNEGRTFTFRNLTTGTVVNQQVLLARAQHYSTDYLMSFTFQHFVSLFEDFFFDLLRLWLTHYPGSLSKKQIDFGTVLNVPDRITLIQKVVDKELNEVKYERVSDWFAYLEQLAKLGCPTVDEIERLMEIKASRDILVHNKSMVNTIYLEKSGSRARFKTGARLEIPDQYHHESWATIKKVVQDVAEAAMRKA